MSTAMKTTTITAPSNMAGEEFCQMVAAQLANPPTAWDW
jgi:hypothetical protein